MFPTLILSVNNKMFLSIKSAYWMISEDWSNDAEYSTLHHRNKLHFKYIQFLPL